VAIVLFDARPNPSVYAARRNFAKVLRRWNADVRHAHLPDDDDRVNGPDDYVSFYGDPALWRVIDGARVEEFIRDAKGRVVANDLDNIRIALAPLSDTPSPMPATAESDCEDLATVALGGRCGSERRLLRFDKDNRSGRLAQQTRGTRREIEVAVVTKGLAVFLVRCAVRPDGGMVEPDTRRDTTARLWVQIGIFDAAEVSSLSIQAEKFTGADVSEATDACSLQQRRAIPSLVCFSMSITTAATSWQFRIQLRCPVTSLHR